MASMASAEAQLLAEFGIPTPPHPANGVGCIIFNEDATKYFLLPGDRHHWPEGVEAQWAELFHPVVEDSEGNKLVKGAPFQVYTVYYMLRFLGNDYGPSEQAGAIVEHCVTKGWFPKCCFTKEAALDIARSGEDYAYSVETDQLKEFHSQLMKFTSLVHDHHYLENVFGAVEGGPTTDPTTIWDTLIREGMEESGMRLTQAQFLCYSPPRASRKTGETTVTAFFIAWVDEQEMTQAFEAKMLKDRPTGHEWACPMPYYKVMSVDQTAAKITKAGLEVLPGAKWHEFDPEGHRLMDAKNKAIVQQYAHMKADAAAPPNPSSHRMPCLNEPEAKRQRAGAWGYDPSAPPPAPAPPAPKADINVRMFGSRQLPEDDVAEFLSMADEMSPKYRLHQMVNDGSVTPLLPQGEHKLPSHLVPKGTEGLYMGEPAKVTDYDDTLPSQYASAGEECLLTIEWEGGRVRIPKKMFISKVTGAMWA